MPNSNPLAPARDKLLFTPGPLTTSAKVKEAMLHDAGSWHFEFNTIVADVRSRLLQLAGLSREAGWEVVLMQGSGTFGVEAVFQSCVPPNGKVVAFTNGAYGDRIGQMLKHARIEHVLLRTPEDTPAKPEELEKVLATDPTVTHVALVHCETTTGILNSIEEVGPIARRHGKIFIVDAMSSFAGMPIDFERCHIDFLISSANKCVESVPGFSFIFARRALLLGSEGWARSLSLDLLGQIKGFEKNGQFRYTPPTHTILAFAQALRELEAEGGIAPRSERYRKNHATLVNGLSRLGIRPYLNLKDQSHIITAFRYPTADFDFDRFYRALSDRGFIIYPGKLTQVNTFRIGNIGRLFPADLEQLVAAIGAVLVEMGISK